MLPVNGGGGSRRHLRRELAAPMFGDRATDRRHATAADFLIW
jgi:hypothetical protein